MITYSGPVMRSSIVVVVVRNAKTVLPKIALWDGRVWQKNAIVSRDLKTGVARHERDSPS